MSVSYTEQGTVFYSGKNRLVGIAALPEVSGAVGVLILVGGPQYRVGSHRQFTLLARSLAESGIPCFRFDFTGMGDSEGERQSFSDVQGDISAALDQFQEVAPQVKKIVAWGLCDAASVALMHAHTEPRICSLVLLNPWVHGGDYSPKVKLSHYYAPLLLGKDTWLRFFTGKIQIRKALMEFFNDSMSLLRNSLGLPLAAPAGHSFVAEMLHGFLSFRGQTLFILSEQDLTAQEFVSLTANDKKWATVMSRSEVTVEHLLGADHTFSKQNWHREMTRLSVEWTKGLLDKN
jgi:exosortase A-associated hydrolase 1